jgi:hypothetical protein
MRRPRIAVAAAAAGALALGLGGCANHLAFGTATKFALDISQQADQTVDVSLGYDRVEVATAPAPNKNADETEDTYSLLGTFHVSYDTPWGGDPLHLNQFFATGWAADTAAQNDAFRRFFAEKAGIIAGGKEDEQ